MVHPRDDEELPVFDLSSADDGRRGTVVMRDGLDPRRGVFIAVLAVAGALVVAALISGGGDRPDGDRTATPTTSSPRTSGPPTTRDRTTTAPTTTPASGPVLGQPTGLELVSGTRQGSLLVIDLDTGEATPLGGGRGSRDVGGGLALTPAGVLVASGSDSRAVLLSPDGELVRTVAQGGGYALSPDRGLLWTFANGPGPGLNGVDVEDGTIENLPLQGNAQLVGATSRGPLVQVYGGGVYEITADGPHRRSPGAFVAADDHRSAWSECDEVLVCTIVVADDHGTELARLHSNPGGFAAGRFSPDGRWLAVADDSNEVAVVDLTTGSTAAPPGFSVQPWGLLGPWFAWSPDSRWLFGRADPGALAAYDTGTGETHTRLLSERGLAGAFDVRAAAPTTDT